MTDTPTPQAPAKPSWLARLRNLLHHPTEDHTKSVVGELLDKVHELEHSHGKLAHRVAALEEVAVKDAPAAVHAVQEAATVAATVAADVEKAAGK